MPSPNTPVPFTSVPVPSRPAPSSATIAPAPTNALTSVPTRAFSANAPTAAREPRVKHTTHTTPGMIFISIIMLYVFGLLVLYNVWKCFRVNKEMKAHANKHSNGELPVCGPYFVVGYTSADCEILIHKDAFDELTRRVVAVIVAQKIADKDFGAGPYFVAGYISADCEILIYKEAFDKHEDGELRVRGPYVVAGYVSADGELLIYKDAFSSLLNF